MLSHFQDLKAQMNKARGEERRKLTKLTKESNGAINELNHLKEQGQAILRLAEHCRKLMVRKRVSVVRIEGEGGGPSPANPSFLSIT